MRQISNETKNHCMRLPYSYELTTHDRYGFNGMEADNEVSGEGNFISFKYRNYDPRIGRMWSIDPLTDKYPFYTPYAFSGNRVIDCREFEGLEPISAIDEKTKEPYFKPVLRLNLPNGDFITIYGSVHGGPYAVSRDDRDKINNFTEQGYSFSLMNNFDATSVNDNGTTVNIQAGVGGVSRSSTDENNIPQWAKEGLFRVNSIQAPSEITKTNTKTEVVNTNGVTNRNKRGDLLGSDFRYLETGKRAQITKKLNLNEFAITLANRLDERAKDLLQNSPANAERTITSIDINVNENANSEYVETLRNSLTAKFGKDVQIKINLVKEKKNFAIARARINYNDKTTKTTTETVTTKTLVNL